jgi:hypothetical protein
MRRYLVLGLLAISVAFNVAAIGSLAYTRVTGPQPAAAAGRCGMGPGGPHLTSTQMASVQALRAQFVESARPLEAEYQLKNAELARVALAGGPDSPRQTDGISREIAELHRQIQLLAVENLRQEAELLDSGQREAYCGALQTRICPAAAGAGPSSGGGCMMVPPE